MIDILMFATGGRRQTVSRYKGLGGAEERLCTLLRDLVPNFRKTRSAVEAENGRGGGGMGAGREGKGGARALPLTDKRKSRPASRRRRLKSVGSLPLPDVLAFLLV